jgi:hypothetical protein
MKRLQLYYLQLSLWLVQHLTPPQDPLAFLHLQLRVQQFLIFFLLVLLLISLFILIVGLPD